MSLLRHGTYSIVARDPASGELGVAVQSHWFSVGSVVPWAKPGVGAVATQANADVSYGPRLLALLEGGHSPSAALARLVGVDAAAASRQVAVVSAAGEVAVHTGRDCMSYAGHVQGPGVSCQANIMADARVWPAMLEAFGAAGGSLADRLVAALDAGERAGGDLRGRQSAALLVVPARGHPWERVVSLRVEDHDDPLAELRRLMGLSEAYRLAARADELVAEGRHGDAATLYEQASARAPHSHELLFWAGLGVAASGDLQRGAARVGEAIEMHPGWQELLRRLPAHVAPAAEPLLAYMATQSR
jgi:uncharacterized Ntn-hydrolase superfamily protein